MHLKMNYWEIYKLPTSYRTWYLKRLTKYFSEKNSNKDKNSKSAPDNQNQKSLKEYESMLQNKFKNN